MEKELGTLIPVEIDYECDVCKRGFMHPTGEINQGFEHKCTNCDNKQIFEIKYPTVKFKKLNEMSSHTILKYLCNH